MLLIIATPFIIGFVRGLRDDDESKRAWRAKVNARNAQTYERDFVGDRVVRGPRTPEAQPRTRTQPEGEAPKPKRTRSLATELRHRESVAMGDVPDGAGGSENSLLGLSDEEIAEAAALF